MPYTPDNKLAFFDPTSNPNDENNAGQYRSLPELVARSGAQMYPVNGVTNAYRSDGVSATMGGSNVSVVARRKLVVLVDGWLEGFYWANVGGTLGPSLGEAPGFQSLNFSVSFCFANAPSVGYFTYTDNALQEPPVTKSAGVFVRPLGGRIRVSRGDVIYYHPQLDGVAGTDAYFTTQYGDRSDGEDIATFTTVAAARAKRDQFPWTPVNAATTAPPFAKIGLPGATQVLITPFKPTASVAVVGTSREEPGNPNPYLSPKLESDGAYSRVLNARGIPSIHLSKGASLATVDLARDKFVLRERLLAPSTHILYGHPQNDLANGVTLAQAQQQALRDTSKWRNEGRVVFGETLYPYVGATPADFFLTAAGQTPTGGAYEASRLAWNAWIRGTLTGVALVAAGGDASITPSMVFDDYLDAAAALESTTLPGRFKDATILRTGTATGGSTTTLVDSSATWTPNSLNGAMVKWTQGGTDYFGSVVANTATTLYITVTSNLRATINGTYYDLSGTVPANPPAAGNVYVLYAPLTLDGLHANEYGKQLLSYAPVVGFNALLNRWNLPS